MSPAELVGSWAAPIARYLAFCAVVLLGFSLIRDISR